MKETTIKDINPHKEVEEPEIPETVTLDRECTVILPSEVYEHLEKIIELNPNHKSIDSYLDKKLGINIDSDLIWNLIYDIETEYYVHMLPEEFVEKGVKRELTTLKECVQNE